MEVVFRKNILDVFFSEKLSGLWSLTSEICGTSSDFFLSAVVWGRGDRNEGQEAQGTALQPTMPPPTKLMRALPEGSPHEGTALMSFPMGAQPS